MPKQIGRNASLLIANSACNNSASNSISLTGDLNSITLTYNADAPEVSVFGAVSKERMFDGIKDWELGFEGYYQQQASAIDEVLFGLLGGSCMIDYGPAGSTTGCNKYTACAILSTYDINFELESAITISGTLVARTGSMSASIW
jgi:hypothetical protein